MRSPDRRAAARISTRLAAWVRTCDGRRHQATICDISLAGMAVIVRNASIARVLPNVERELKHLPVEVVVEFDTDDERKGHIVVLCGVAHFRRVAPGDCLMGLAYRLFLDDGEKRLAEYWQTVAAQTIEAGRPE